MKTNVTCGVLKLILLVLLSTGSIAQTTYHYDFRNTFDETSGTGPALNVLGTGAFVNESQAELSCISRPVYGFTQNSGLQFDNTVANNFIGSSYSVEMYFQFLNNSGFKRIIDYKNQSSDSGVYSTATQLWFYDELTVNTTAFVSNQYVYFAITRDAATNVVALYVDGNLAGSFIDATGLALLDNSNVMNFFQDDTISAGEARPGRIAMLKIHDYVLDAATVTGNFSSLNATLGTLAFTPDITGSCLIGNSFNFTNLSQNAGGYTYTWEFGDGNSIIDTNASHSYSAAGTYDVLLIAANGSGCIDTVSTQIQVYNAAPVNLGPDVSICFGDSVTLDAGPGFTSYLWNTGATDPTITVSASGTYFAEVIDSTGCSGVDSIVVDVVLYPILDLGVDTTLCFGQTATLNATPGLASYLWSTGDTTESITVGTSGIYAVQVANSTGCSVSDTLVVSVNPEIIISLGPDTTFCDGNTLILDAGAGFAAYLWSDASQLQTLSVTTSGTYYVAVTDLLGCTETDTVEVVVNPLPVVDLGADTSFCGGTVLVLDAGSGFSGYLWSDGSINQTLGVTDDGTWSVTVTDANGCTNTDDIMVTATPIISLGPDQIWCTGVTATLDAGSGFNSYLWSDGSVNQTLDVTATGIYTITVSDSTGCVNSDEIAVTFNNIPVIDLGPDFDICDNETAILDPGSGYYAYAWSTGSTDSILFVTVAGTYSVIVSSAPNCDATDTITIGVLPAPPLELGQDTVLCDGSSLLLDAGAGLLSYLWSDGTTNQTLNVATTGVYSVTITDFNGCENTDSLLVTFEGPPFLELGPDLSICDGTATVLDAGPGMATYLWSDGSTSQMLLVSTAGTYSVTIATAAGCSSQDSITITVLSSPVVALGLDTTLCDGQQLILDAGAGFNSYLWNDGSTSQTYTVTSAGNYTVVVTDANNCNGTDDIEVTYYAPVPTPTITQLVNTLQSSVPTGNQWYSVPGGIIPGETNQTYSPGQNGTYYVIVTDSNGCVSAPSPDFIFVLDGIATIGSVQLALVPNPASSQLTIYTTGWTVPSYKLEMIDILGKTVFSMDKVPTGKFLLNINAFSDGIYFIKVSSDQFQSTKRLIINR